MSLCVRPARPSDLEDLYKLARQFVLLNLPASKTKLEQLLVCSEKSFKGELSKLESQYVFVVEDREVKKVVATSKIVAKHGTPDDPHLYYKILKKEKFSKDLGIGFIHQVLRFGQDEDGPTELGGLVVDEAYRGRPEKVGKLVSLSRFAYMAAFPEKFEERLHCELAPPLELDGRSSFWEALGRRFTGLPYDEADRLSHLNKEFIQSLFPEEDLYMSVLEAKARLVVGEVGPQTRPARALMESWGFKYKNEVDPFDGGPHLGVAFKEAKPIQAFRRLKLKFDSKVVVADGKLQLLAGFVDESFLAQSIMGTVDGKTFVVNPEMVKAIGWSDGQEVFVLSMSY